MLSRNKTNGWGRQRLGKKGPRSQCCREYDPSLRGLARIENKMQMQRRVSENMAYLCPGPFQGPGRSRYVIEGVPGKPGHSSFTGCVQLGNAYG